MPGRTFVRAKAFQSASCLSPVQQNVSALRPHANCHFTGRNRTRANKTQRTPKGSAKKNTQRLTGVRMRHRGTVVQRNRNEWSMEGPHPGVRTSTPTAIHAHCLLLFCSFFGPEMPDLSSVLSCRPCCFHLLFALRPTSSPVFSRNSKKTASSARQDGICN